MLLPVSLPDETPALLLLAGPDASPVQITLRLDADQVASLTVREERRALAPAPTVRMKWRSLLPATGARGLRAGLLTLGRTQPGPAGAQAPLQPILCPFWPAARLASEDDSIFFTAALFAVWEPDGSRAAIVTGFPAEDYAFTLDTHVAPVLVGRFEELPEPRAITDETAECAFSWVETGPLDQALTLMSTLPAPVGPSLHGAAWRVLPFAARQRDARAGGVVVRVDRQRLGYGRDEAEAHYPQVPARALEIRQDLQTWQVASLLGHFLDCEGSVRPFWAPAATAACRLAAPATALATEITLTDASALLGHSHLWIADGDAAQAARKIEAVAGDVVTLNAAVGFAPRPGATLVQPLLFVRFARPEIVLEWLGGEAWRVDAMLRELPAEYLVAGGETHGTDHGPLTPPAWCYEITDGTQTWRLTSYAAPLTLGGQTYEPAQISHGELKERINLDASEAVLTLRDWPDSPFGRYRLERAPGPITITIHEGVPAAGVLTGASAIWAGRVRAAKWDGPLLELAVGGFGALLDQPAPRWLMQPTCSTSLFHPAACKLDREQWTFTATRAHPQAAGYVHDLTSLEWRGGAPLPAFGGAGYFAGGYIVRPRAGQADQMIAVVNSQTIGLVQRVTLAAALSPAPSGAELWSLIPGCDGRLESCRAKFGNLVNFRGFASMPLNNPSITIRRKQGNGGKK